MVERVEPRSALARAGIQAGDRLLTWERRPNSPTDLQGARGSIGSVFDWMWLTVEQAPRGALVLTGERDGETTVFEVLEGSWEADVRPAMSQALLARHLTGKDLATQGNSVEGVRRWREAIQLAEEEDHWSLQCWLFLRIGEVLAAAGEDPSDVIQQAFTIARDPASQVAVREAAGEFYSGLDDVEAAESHFRAGLKLSQAVWGESLQVAHGRRLLGKAAWQRGELAQAKGHFSKALEIQLKLSPSSLATAESLNALGTVAAMRGELRSASKFFRRGLRIKEDLEPESLSVAYSLNNLGALALDRGDLQEAAGYLERALQIKQDLAPQSATVAESLDNLGGLTASQGDLELAQEYWRRSLAIRENLPGEQLLVADSLNNLGIAAFERGSLELAGRHWQEAVHIKQRLAPASLSLAHSLNNLGELAHRRGRLELAAQYYEEALRIKEMRAPAGLDVAFSLHNLGLLAADRQQPETAKRYFEKALEIRSELVPGSSLEADSLSRLALLHEKNGRPDLAEDYLDRSLRALDQQISKLGGSPDAKGRLRARHKSIYRHSVRLQVDLNNPEKAFALLERSRGQSFLELLAEREIDFSADLPAGLESARSRNSALYDRTVEELATLSPFDEEQRVQELLGEQRMLRRERQRIAQEIRRAAPRLAALHSPQTLDFEAARQALDGTASMLSYSVGEERTDLFIVSEDSGLIVEKIGLGEEELRSQVERFRELIRLSVPGSQRGTQRRPQLIDAAKRLFALLIEPAARHLEKSQRILVLADGPLHALPFSALVRRVSDDGSPQYLAQWKPIHFALSATVYAELKKARRQPTESDASASVALTAFGDPHFPAPLGLPGAEGIGDRRLRSLAARGFQFRPLPASRIEVGKIAALFAGDRIIHLGREATEERAKAVDPATRYLHFATHGLIDPRFPLNSALVLAIPEGLSENRDNGLLQVWEILESVRIEADLVVLSACDSGLGPELAGEGLIGLTRAFQYAGARTVAASLWKIADRTTAELMVRFYRHLKAGKPKDEALQAAQLELISRPIRVKDERGRLIDMDASAPYYWAAFQLMGDWK